MAEPWQDELHTRTVALLSEARAEYERPPVHPLLVYAIRWLARIDRQLQAQTPDLDRLRHDGYALYCLMVDDLDFAITETGEKLLDFASDVSRIGETQQTGE